MKKTQTLNHAPNVRDFNLDNHYSRYYWILIPLLTAVYYIYSQYSSGFYQDDEVAHFINARDFWHDPFIIMSNWGKPGWKIFIVLPSLLGYDILQLFNSVISAFTVYFTIILSMELGLKNSILSGIFLAFQPHFLQLAFRTYAEIFTGLLLVLTLIYFYREKYIISSLLCGLAFTVRQEVALLCIVLAIYIIIKKKYIPVLFIGLFPAILNLIGFLKTGDMLWIWTEMRSLGEFNLGIERSFFHYFQVYIFITGPVVFSLLLVGFTYPFLLDNPQKKLFYSREFVLYLFVIILFLFQCYLVAKGTNPGSWRYMLQVSPFASIIALIGFNELLKSQNKKYPVWILGTAAVVTLLFLSKESTGLLITDKPEYLKLAVILVLLAGSLIWIIFPTRVNPKPVISVAVILTLFYTFYTEKPKPQSPQNITVSKISQWYNGNIDRSRPVLYNHSLVLFYAGIFGKDRANFRILNKQSLNESPSGTLIIWDSHYSYRPEYKNDVQLTDLQNNPAFRLINSFISSDKRFAAYIFEKL